MEFVFAFLVLLSIFFISMKIKNDKKHKNRISKVADSLNESLNGFYSEYNELSTEYISHSKALNFIDRWSLFLRQIDSLDITKKDAIFPKIQQFRNDYNTINESIVSLNTAFVTKEMKRYDGMLSNIDGKSLDTQQREVVVTDEDHNLVIAGAGSGKTLTIAGKVKYLCEAKGINPADILLIAFTKKSAEEMTERISNRLNIPIVATTFHKLGLDIIKLSKHSCPEVNDSPSETIKQYFELSIKDNPDVMKSLIQYFAYYLHVPPDVSQFSSLGAAFEYEKSADLETLKSKYESSQYLRSIETAKKANKETLQGERVKSIEEVMIANFLFLNGIEYEYEALYPFSSDNPQYKNYRPDFFLPKYNIYLEHFGISKDNRLPWLSEVEERKYLDSMKWKREFHKTNKTKLIETYSYFVSEGTLFEQLEKILLQNNVKFIEPDFVDVFNKIYGSASDKYLSEFVKLCCTFITLFKSNNYKTADLWKLDYADKKRNNAYHAERRKLFFSIIEDVLITYEKSLSSSNSIDFSDMINLATDEVIAGCAIHQYRYIIIDEYQDISVGRYKLVKAILDRTNAKLLCVGDDWQSIYRFTGSDISLFTDFERYFGYSSILKIEQTYRNSQELIDIVGRFVTQNPNQIKKSLRSSKVLAYPLTFLFYSDDPFAELKRAVDKIVVDFGDNHSILILGRTTYDFELIKQSKLFEVKGSNIKYIDSPSVPISFMTVHKSKGLEADNVILVNFQNSTLGFPNKISNDVLLELVLHEKEEIIYAEERRLLYVALTRSRNRVFVLTDSNKPSEFLHDFEGLQNICFYDKSSSETATQIDCPRCKSGRLLVRQNDNNNQYFVGCSNYPGCTYTLKDITVLRSAERCPHCGGFLVKRNGQHGYFLGCTNYPYCTFTQKLLH